MSTVFGGVHTVHSLPALLGGPVLRSYSEPINREGEILAGTVKNSRVPLLYLNKEREGCVTTE